ncbi:MAG: TonB-dependent receptor [Bacteroidales bacterium]|nr:TonB-dependent receptor [Bacteroidales bacterium]
MNKYLGKRKLHVLLIITISIISCLNSTGQITIQGKIINKKGEPLPYIHVMVENTINGTITDENGVFSFTTAATGDQWLLVKCIGYETVKKQININKILEEIEITLEESALDISEVVVTAGAIEARNDRKVAILTPLDIYTNSAAAADIVGAIQTLPGTHKVGNQTGLFVRGGDAAESSVIIDGMVVQNPFFSNVPGVSQRSRFSPFQFEGISFSSGGYSARYGQALSSILELTTADLPDESTLFFGASMGGAAVGGIKRWENTGLDFTGEYVNVAPFYSMADKNYEIFDVPEGGAFSGRYVSKIKDKGLFKAYIKHDFYTEGMTIPDPFETENTLNFKINNKNTYFNSSYRHNTDNNQFFTGFSFSNNEDKIKWGTLPAGQADWRVQWRGELWHAISDKMNLLLGLENQNFSVENTFDTLIQHFDEIQLATYLETNYKPWKKLAIKTGVRYQYSRILEAQSLAPRLAMAFKTGKYTQISIASSIFYQNPENRYLLYGYRPKFQQAIHYIANFQRIANDRSLRLEGYYKDYNQLIMERNTTTLNYSPNDYRYLFGTIDNSGYGYARGVDLFWRDKATIPNFDYWITYSYIDTKRFYENFLSKAAPPYISDHNLNVLLKYFIVKWGLSLNTAYTYASGKPYYNPVSNEFLGDNCPDIHNISFSMSYLATFGRCFSVIYLSVDNIFNRENIYGYRYSFDGQERYEMRPAIDRWIFAGINLSLTQFSRDEL